MAHAHALIIGKGVGRHATVLLEGSCEEGAVQNIHAPGIVRDCFCKNWPFAGADCSKNYGLDNPPVGPELPLCLNAGFRTARRP